ncbi:MAG: hypothetical protein ACYS1A_09880 [Planctomycetota bacterium]|jgi:hypothetical protein
MGVKYRILAVLVVFGVLLGGSVCEAVGTRAIDRVRDKSVLDEGDFQVIDDFVAAGVQELVRTRDFTSIAKVRATILGRVSSSTESARAQYAEKFSESARKYISEAFGAAAELVPQERKFKVVLNLLILVDGLEDLRLVDLAMNKLNDENEVVRYWAVHSITNPGITKQLNSTNAADLKLARNIIGRLTGLVDNGAPEMIELMAEFAAEVDMREGEDLLLQIVDMRIRKYADWTVEFELLDMTILKLLYDKISSEGRNQSAVTNRFGQLLSYVMQRYFNGREWLNDTQKAQLASVLVEIEKSCISNLLIAQSVIKKAIEQEDYMSISLEHSRLFGDETQTGKLVEKVNIDYGKNPDGGKRTIPLALPEPPKIVVEEES